MGITWVVWNHLATPKRLGGTGVLNLSKHMMASWWQLINGCISLRISGSTCVKHLGTSWQEALFLCVWKPSSGREHCNYLHKELLVSSRLLCWPGKERLRSKR